jgi:hypothetical protein
MEQQDFCKNPIKLNFKQGDRESEMEMNEVERERGAVGGERKKTQVR